MSILNIFSRQSKNTQQYEPVSEEEDKMLPSQTQPSKELLRLQRSNKNLKIVIGIVAAVSCLFGALLVFQNRSNNNLMIPKILRTPVPPSEYL